jgi:hypothetical protein
MQSATVTVGATTEIGTLQAAVKACRDARNCLARDRNSPDSRTQFNDFPLTVEEFIRIIATAADPIDLVDLGGRREIRTRTGMTSGHLQQLIEDTAGGERVRAGDSLAA